VYEQTGVKPKELADQPELPKELTHIWGWFLELLNVGDFKWSELDAWSRLKRIQLTSTEIELLLALNQLYASSHHGR